MGAAYHTTGRGPNYSLEALPFSCPDDNVAEPQLNLFHLRWDVRATRYHVPRHRWNVSCTQKLQRAQYQVDVLTVPGTHHPHIPPW